VILRHGGRPRFPAGHGTLGQPLRFRERETHRDRPDRRRDARRRAGPRPPKGPTLPNGPDGGLIDDARLREAECAWETRDRGSLTF